MYMDFNLYEVNRAAHEDRLRDAEQARLANQFHHNMLDGFASRVGSLYKRNRTETEK